MRSGNRRQVAVIGAIGAMVLLAGACSSSSKSSGGPATTAAAAQTTTAAPASTVPVVKSSRGFDGTTIKVAGITNTADFAGAEIGSEARFKRFNDTNEIPGIKIQFVEMANDHADPATALSEVRRLVTSDQVFAIVPDLSAVNPGQYLAAQQVPYLGYAFDNTYCSSTGPSTSIWGFGFDGCLVPAAPPREPDLFGPLFKYVSQKTGKAHPTMVIFSNDNQSGKNVRFQASAAEGAGFDVLYAKGAVPIVTSDYTPYVQTWMTVDGGKAPDVISCELATQCIPIWSAVKAAGFKGVYYQSLGPVGALVKAFAGTTTFAAYNTSPNAGLTQMQADLQAFKAGTTPVGYSNVPAYFAADMFIQALKKVGTDVTPAAVQKALSTITWGVPDLVGPVQYPASTVVATPVCNELISDLLDGSGFSTVEPFACSSTTYPIDPKFTG